MAFTYKNGRVPADLLVTFASGWLPGEGTWYHQLPPATYAKHLALVALAKRNTGRTLKISEGWGAYRPYNVQVYAKSIHGIYAASPGTSSHGMYWEGQQCAAIDYGNWSYVYNGNREAFYRDVRAVGMEPGLISVPRGYPDEPWHVVDKNPWAAGGAVAGGATGGTVAPETKREDIMASIPPLAKQANSNNIWAINPNGTKRLVAPAEMDVYKSIAAKLKIDINSYIAEDTAISQIKNG